MDDSREAADNVELRTSDTNTDSDRVLVTKRAIFFALRDLMQERDFGKISVGDIMERAGVSRSTFYRCFSDKFDVVNWAYKRYKNIRTQDKGQYYSFETSLLSQLEYLSENRAFFSAALRYKGQNSLRQSIVQANDEYMLECWHAAHGTGNPTYAERATIRFAAAGFANVIVSWVINGCVQPPESVVDIICTCIPAQVLETLF